MPELQPPRPQGIDLREKPLYFKRLCGFTASCGTPGSIVTSARPSAREQPLLEVAGPFIFRSVACRDGLGPGRLRDSRASVLVRGRAATLDESHPYQDQG